MKFNKLQNFITLTEDETLRLKGILAPRFYYIFIAPVMYLIFLLIYRASQKNIILRRKRLFASCGYFIVLSICTLVTLVNVLHNPFLAIFGPIYTYLYILTDISFNIASFFNFFSVFVLIHITFNLYWLVGDLYE